MAFDLARHPRGYAMSWLSRVTPGDLVGLVGVRHDFHAGAGVDHHLVVADASALPAAADILASLDGSAPVTAYLQAGHPADRCLLPRLCNVDVNWVIAPPPQGAGSPLEQAVRGFRAPPGRTQAWLAAEAAVVRSLRQFARSEAAVATDDLHAVAYWRSGRSSSERDRDAVPAYQRAAAAGRDLTDPAVIQDIELR